jgi:hypothetical protein
VQADGAHLGIVGSYIVAETIIGLLEGDSRSYLTRAPLFQLCYGSGGDFKMADLIKFAQTAAPAATAVGQP